MPLVSLTSFGAVPVLIFPDLLIGHINLFYPLPHIRPVVVVMRIIVSPV
jgi:hypothetical protein